ncbi:5-formyltetrahydrofolate cyclo-ligase [Acinetobacter sp. ANC 4558]|uniref:5-formyltetrahydrofolate cyclo-ligase n=1 Tax=Acinetobacter sp. ANC 4558 TaxID=1977876 RepID=UPI00148A5D47
MMNIMHKLRRQLRKQRRQLNHFQQLQAESRVFHQLIRTPEFISAKHIGIYLHAFGEIRTHKIIEYAFSKNKKIYLPLICNMNQHLVWVQINLQQYRNKRFSLHHLGMQEPKCTRGLHVSKLELLIMPLLACNEDGIRVGMGGGFYDRTLAHAQYKPTRLGLAHDFQLIHHKIIPQKWDEALDGLIIPTKLLRFKRK